MPRSSVTATNCDSISFCLVLCCFTLSLGHGLSPECLPPSFSHNMPRETEWHRSWFGMKLQVGNVRAQERIVLLRPTSGQPCPVFCLDSSQP
ncbi:hypothetical protein VFPPC_17824 [Pochonia chlamydosporia 170]|uniref:Secreted protein n=1 Tax=Pochonia chlamydosporia 170 TaxID=1380566 RepID=A0A219AQC5_METCM|nr:hypothetical protein VFPPC_17824 [Pochonia chlamydosporia 170]OWT42983.1 hypothetical protein VFPPC_17824 [Pochonia chlamydosporia 170]